MPEADGTDVWLAAWRMIRRRLWLIASLVTLICLLALPAILALPKLYHAESRVMVTASPALALAAEDGRAVLELDGGRGSVTVVVDPDDAGALRAWSEAGPSAASSFWRR